jgi:hypothetical protein
MRFKEPWVPFQPLPASPKDHYRQLSALIAPPDIGMTHC